MEKRTRLIQSTPGPLIKECRGVQSDKGSKGFLYSMKRNSTGSEGTLKYHSRIRNLVESNNVNSCRRQEHDGKAA